MALYERNRTATNSTNTSNTSVSTNDTGSTILLQIIRMIGMLDTRISMDIFDASYQPFVKLFQSLLEADIHAAATAVNQPLPVSSQSSSLASAASWFMNDDLMTKLLCMILYVLHREITSSTSLPSSSSSSSSSLNDIIKGASSIIFEVFGALIRLTSINIEIARYLAPITALCCW
jgi:hypothetical protein